MPRLSAQDKVKRDNEVALRIIDTLQEYVLRIDPSAFDTEQVLFDIPRKVHRCWRDGPCNKRHVVEAVVKHPYFKDMAALFSFYGIRLRTELFALLTQENSHE